VGEAGILVDPEDPEGIAEGLKRVLTDEELRATMEELGLERASSFSWERVARETLDVYREVLER
jgi:glycosyltransferase involved in cell wall biosynthesis